jgi:signal recognition particle subunit SRP54
LFESLADRLQGVLKRLRGKGTLSEQDVDEALREVRMALLEADVNFKVVRTFVASVRERAVGAEVLQSLTPVQHVIKIVNDELVEMLGGGQSRLNVAGAPPSIIMLVGLQGAGKTTMAAKLALMLRNQNQRPLLVAADIYRPAAVQQLETLGKQLNIPVHSEGTKVLPEVICANAVKRAREEALTVVILDTAGRLQIDEAMMAEVVRIKERVQPHEVLLVADAMTGQEAVKVAQEFHNHVTLTGMALTKADGDARGGAALSIRSVVGVPIKFLGISEKPDGIEPFYPDRLASRILGMGDVLSLIEKAQESYSEDQARAMEKKLRTATFNLEDMLQQMQAIKKMGPLSGLVKMIPGMSSLMKDDVLAAELDGKATKRLEAIIYSMTPQERRNPHIIDGRRKRRIARGSGTSPQDINQLLNQFESMRRMMKQMSRGKIPKGFPGLLE